MKKFYEFTNNVIFNLVMQDEAICKDVLERIFADRKIGEVKIGKRVEFDTEKTVTAALNAKAVRLDVYFEDENSWYDIEMQVANEHNIGLRSRYIHGVNDVKFLNSGMNYEEMKNAFVIFICMFDPFGCNRPIYHFQSACEVDAHNILPLKDGRYTIILNTESNDNDIAPELRALLDYIKYQLVPSEDDGIKQIADAVRRANMREGLEGMMTYEEEIQRLEKKIERMARNHEKAIAEENAKGRDEERIITARNFMKEGIAVDVISRCTGLTPEEIAAL